MKLFDRPSRNWAYVSILCGLIALGSLYVFLIAALPLLLICIVTGIAALRVKPSSKLGWVGLAMPLIWFVYLCIWLSAFSNAYHGTSADSSPEAHFTTQGINL